MTKKNLENNAEVTNTDSKIDAIKHLIFGDNIAEYSQEFETLKNDLEKRRQESVSYTHLTLPTILLV